MPDPITAQVRTGDTSTTVRLTVTSGRCYYNRNRRRVTVHLTDGTVVYLEQGRALQLANALVDAYETAGPNA